MQKKALLVIDIQNDITKNYKEVIGNINKSIDWATENEIHIIYIRHENLSAGTRTFKPGTHGVEFASDLKIVSENVFTKVKPNTLSCEEFVNFIKENEISEFFLTGADAAVCVKSTCYNLCKAGYDVTVFSDCIACWSKKKIGEMLEYYKSKGGRVVRLSEFSV